MGDSGDNGEEAQWSCCNDRQTLFLLLYLAYICLALITWNTYLAKPLRLMAVFLHEMSHAIACWLTCGEVLQLHVYDSEGGVTRYIGGCRAIIIPAGYVGTAFWAMVFVIVAGGRRSATAAALCFVIALFVTLCHAPNRTLVYICVFYALITIGVIAIEYYWYSPVLQFVILFYGVFVGVYAIEDIWQDVVKREIEGSDAYACHKEVWPCCSPRCVGLQWALLAILFQLLGIWITCVEMSEECENLGWFECINLSIDLNDFDLERNWDFDGWWHNEGAGDNMWWNSDGGP